MSTILLCLALTVFHEARGEPILGQQAVAQVVLNRARIRGTTPCDAVLEKGQFSWHPERAIRAKRTAGRKEFLIVKAHLPTGKRGWVAALRAAKAALDSQNTFKDAEFFHAKRVKPGWKRRFVEVFRVGNHVFYARKGRNLTEKMAFVAPSGAIFERFLV